MLAKPIARNPENEQTATTHNATKLQPKRRTMSNKGGGNRRSGGRHGSGDKALSHALSWALRHAALSIGLKMSSDGFVPLEDILTSSHPRFAQHSWTEADVRRVVAQSDKQRFRLEQRTVGGRDGVLCIRANQGHSIPNIVCSELLTPISADELRSGNHCSRDVPRGMGEAHSDRRAVQDEAQSHSLCFGFARWRKARHIGDAIDVSNTHLCGRWKVR